jgi:hypothetical protein
MDYNRRYDIIMISAVAFYNLVIFGLLILVMRAS